MPTPNEDHQHLARLRDYYRAHGALPSHMHLARLLGFQSTGATAKLLARLRVAGYVKPTPDRRFAPTARFFARPVLSNPVRAGVPDPIFDESHANVTIDAYLIEKPSKTVLVRVKGDSMIDAGIMDGDLLVVERKPTANVGDIVIAIVDNEFTVKTLKQERGRFVLVPANKAYPVIRPKDALEIFGVMVGLVRKTA